MRAAVAAMAECRRGWSAAGLNLPVMVLGDVLVGLSAAVL
jgi:hypothetical protein